MYGADFREIKLVIDDVVVRGYATRVLPEELTESEKDAVSGYERYYVAHRENGNVDDLCYVRRLSFRVLHAWTIYLESPVDRYTNNYGELMFNDSIRLEFL